jgi:hypothetical protein
MLFGAFDIRQFTFRWSANLARSEVQLWHPFSEEITSGVAHGSCRRRGKSRWHDVVIRARRQSKVPQSESVALIARRYYIRNPVRLRVDPFRRDKVRKRRNLSPFPRLPKIKVNGKHLSLKYSENSMENAIGMVEFGSFRCCVCLLGFIEFRPQQTFLVVLFWTGPTGIYNCSVLGERSALVDLPTPAAVIVQHLQQHPSCQCPVTLRTRGRPGNSFFIVGSGGQLNKQKKSRRWEKSR